MEATSFCGTHLINYHVCGHLKSNGRLKIASRNVKKQAIKFHPFHSSHRKNFRRFSSKVKQRKFDFNVMESLFHDKTASKIAKNNFSRSP